MTLREHIDHARKHGFDRIGPGNLARGPACECCWWSGSHGDECPEHGCTGRTLKQAEAYTGTDSARADERRRCHAALKRVFAAFAARRTFPASAEAIEVAWLAAMAEGD